jgi:hypothetical protein
LFGFERGVGVGGVAGVARMPMMMMTAEWMGIAVESRSS